MFFTNAWICSTFVFLDTQQMALSLMKRLDKGTEYFSNAQRKVYPDRGINIEETLGYCPRQNGKARTMLVACIVCEFSVEQISPSVNEDKTPAEIWFGYKADASKFLGVKQVVFRQQSFLVNQRSSCREHRPPGKLFYGHNFEQLKLSTMEFQ